MSLAPGTRFGSYEVAAQIGVGGMGEVYRARDIKLNRDVALKALPDSFVNDPDRLARFQREAHVLASLSHPNIAAIYGIEEVPSTGSGQIATRALVMELVDGATLAERITEGPIPIDEAVGIATQIAEALGAAHDQGVIHRDLKPANIKVKADGTVKVLDFGLAKAIEPAVSRSNDAVSQSPTITTPAMTQMGVLLGTAAYMSPEQAKGRPTDKRSDVWAFGCVLYEMVTRSRAFAEDDISETLAAVLKSEPDWTRLPADLPPAIRTLIQRCLVKDRRQRVADISAAKFVLCELGNLGGPAAANVAAMPRLRWRRALPSLAAAAVTAAIAGIAVWLLRPIEHTPVVARFSMAVPENSVFSAGRPFIAISPDGTRIVYAGSGGLLLRSIGELVTHTIPGTESQTVGVLNPLFSSDGQSLAFFSVGEGNTAASTTLKRVHISGGTASSLATLGVPFGASWDADGILVGQGAGGIVRVKESGGPVEVIARVTPEERAYGPQMLPGGHTLLFTIGTNVFEDGWDNAQIVAQSLRDGSRRVLINGSDGRYVPTGHLVYAVSGTVFAAPFDVETLTLSGPSVPIVVGVRRSAGSATAATQLALSDTGTLIYMPGPATASSALRNVVVESTPLKLTPGGYAHPRVSPNGKVLAVGQNIGRESDIWTYDLSGQAEIKKLTFEGNNRLPVWSADSKRVTFQSAREGDRAIFWQPFDGSGTREQLTKPAPGEQHIPESWSRDGTRLLFSVLRDGKFSLWVLTLDGKRAQRFGSVRSNEPLSATFSPNGRWIAYAINEGSGGVMSPNRGVYVQPFPATGELHQAPKRVLDFHPLWAPDGKSIFYIPSAARSTVSVPIATHPAVDFGTPVELSRAPKPSLLSSDFRGYDVLPDGRFLSIVPASDDGSPSASNTELRVVLNWTEELKRLAPTR